mgnify:FL=1
MLLSMLIGKRGTVIFFLYFINFPELIFNLIGLVLFQIDVFEVVEIMYARASQ